MEYSLFDSVKRIMKPSTFAWEFDPLSLTTGEEIFNRLQCSICHDAIIEFRYTCVQCSDFDMCGACTTNGEHQQHYVLRVPQQSPIQQAETEAVLDTIRQHLINTLHPQSSYYLDPGISVKPENDVEQNDIIIEEHILDDIPYNTSLPTDSTEDHNYSAWKNSVSSGDIHPIMGVTGMIEMTIQTRDEHKMDSEHPTILRHDGSTYDAPSFLALSAAKRKLPKQENTNKSNETIKNEDRLTMVCVPAPSRPMIEINAGNIVIPRQAVAKPVTLVQLLRTPKEAFVNPPDT